MKIGHQPPSLPTDTARAAGRRGGQHEPFSLKADNKPEDAGASKTIPPGLERVRARLESLGEARSDSQTHVLSRIERNIARYQETQALAGSIPPPPPPAPEPEPETTATDAATPEAAPIVAGAPEAETPPAPASPEPTAEAPAAGQEAPAASA